MWRVGGPSHRFTRPMKTPIQICATCAYSQKPCMGKCLCTVSGRDMREHYETRSCPKGFFDWPPADIPEDYVPSARNATAGGCGCAGDQQHD